MNTERVALWDNIKFIIITRVVIAHLAQEMSGSSVLCNAVYLFVLPVDMPIMFFISGLFHSEKNTTSRCLFFISAGFLLKIAFTVIRGAFVGTDAFDLLSDGNIAWFFLLDCKSKFQFAKISSRAAFVCKSKFRN